MNEKPQDWHRADIIAALKKKKLTLRQLSTESGMNKDSLKNALDKKWPKGEQIIANALGVTPDQIWPSRYQ